MNSEPPRKNNFLFCITGPPQKPTNLYITELTSGSVVLHWTAGYDGGSPQNFIVFKRIDGNEYIQVGFVARVIARIKDKSL